MKKEEMNLNAAIFVMNKLVEDRATSGIQETSWEFIKAKVGLIIDIQFILPPISSIYKEEDAVKVITEIRKKIGED